MTETAVAFENQIVKWDVVPADQLLANPKNPRRHPPLQRRALVGSLKDLGIIAPVLVNLRTGFMIDGHARVEEILSVDPQRPVPVAFVDLSPEDEAKAIAVFDRITDLAEVDREKLEELLRQVETEEPGLQRLLADMARQHRISLAPPGEGLEDPGAELDRADELQAKWAVEPGQIWQVGQHRLLCADSATWANVERLLGQERAHICWTDPPWNVAYGESDHPSWKKRSIQNDNLGAEFPAFARRFCEVIAQGVIPGAPIYMAMSAQEWPTIDQALRVAGFHWSSTIIWVKDHAVLSRKDYHTRYEPLWYGWRTGAPRICALIDRTQNDVWEIPRPIKSEEHPTMKPVELVLRALRNSSELGNIVFDPFVGSGTTAVAAALTGCRCFGIDLEPKYVAVTLERLTGMGLEARLADSH